MDVTPISVVRRKKTVAKRHWPVENSAASESDSDSSSSDAQGFVMKKRKTDPDPHPPEQEPQHEPKEIKTAALDEENKPAIRGSSCKQFWKAGDYEEETGRNSSSQSGGGMDHLRVHPRFLHSNATSHKWALGALAELLDNSLDEVCNGATFVNVDVILNKKHNNTKMLLVEDNGGGMNPDKLRQCMSLGYSLKSKLANTIGQYGNGFKTSTMRLGADVIVFSRCSSRNGGMTQSIGLLSYTFLRATGKEDIVVPIIDFKRDEVEEANSSHWEKLIRSSPSDWSRNLETILEWSPYTTEEELLEQFNGFQDHGTKIVIYNLWEDDEGKLELDFDTDEFDIQMRGANRDEQKIDMAKIYPNSKHFLTYRHSLRSYASILYLRIPQGYRMILRGKEIEHHDMVNDLMLTKVLTYRPSITDPKIPKNDPNMVATGTIGFVKDAKAHFDIQGFNVYHKNRLIKPFWRVWNSAGSDGRGVIGVLEANFVEPAHDKQGFESTTALARLQRRLMELQKDFWCTNCQEIGYAARRNKKDHAPEAADNTTPTTKTIAKHSSNSNGNLKVESWATMKEKKPDDPLEVVPTEARINKKNAVPSDVASPTTPAEAAKTQKSNQDWIPQAGQVIHAEPISTWNPNWRLERTEKTVVGNPASNKLSKAEKSVENLVRSLEEEQEKQKELEKKLEEAKQEKEELTGIFIDERNRRNDVEDELRKKLKDASNTIRELLDKVKSLESRIV